MGIPISVIIIRVFVGLKTQFYWLATEDLNHDPTEDEFMHAIENNGPFNTEAEADAAAKIAVVGEDCVVKKSGMWDPAWNRPQ